MKNAAFSPSFLPGILLPWRTVPSSSSAINSHPAGQKFSHTDPVLPATSWELGTMTIDSYFDLIFTIERKFM